MGNTVKIIFFLVLWGLALLSLPDVPLLWAELQTLHPMLIGIPSWIPTTLLIFVFAVTCWSVAGADLGTHRTKPK